jgi:hypothetical protein
LAVGAFGYNNGSSLDGGVYIYAGSSGGIGSQTATATPTITGKANSGGDFGLALSAGDIDADGYADLVAGATRYNNGALTDGAVYQLKGSNSGITATTVGTPDLVGIASSTEHLGYFVTLVDLNSDGYLDLAAGAPYSNNGAANDGAVYIFNGTNSGIQSVTLGTPNLLGPPSTSHLFGFTGF